VITWPEFVLEFTLASVILLVLCRSLFRGAWLRLLQTMVFVGTSCFLIDYPAETRELWWFPQRTGIEILETPIENHIFIATCTTDLLIVYLSLRSRYRDTISSTERPR